MTHQLASLPTLLLAGRVIPRLGLGTMSLAGRRVLGPPADPWAAEQVLERAVAGGVRLLDTAGFYGPRTVHELIREVLAPYPEDLVISTKLGLTRDERGRWPVALTRDELRAQVEDDLQTLGVEALDLVVLRLGTPAGPQEGIVGEPLEVLAELVEEGLIRHAGLSAVTDAQLAEAQSVLDVACVQNHYAVTARGDDALLRRCAAAGIPYVAYSPTGGVRGPRSEVVSQVAARHGVGDRQLALAWLLAQPGVVPIPGTSSPDHLAELLAAAELTLSEQDLTDLEAASL